MLLAVHPPTAYTLSFVRSEALDKGNVLWSKGAMLNPQWFALLHGRYWRHSVLLVGCCALAWLPWSVRFVPLLDYPNWLVEAHILGNVLAGAGTSDGLWEAGSFSTPNIAVPLLLALLSRIIPIELAGKIVLSMYLASFPLGLYLLGARTRDGQAHGGLLAMIWAFNLLFFFGYVSYLLSLTIAVFGIVVLQQFNRTDNPTLLIYLGLLSLLTYTAHLFGYLVLLVVILVRVAATAYRRTVRRWWLLPATQVLPLILLAHYSLQRLGTGDMGNQVYALWLSKLSSLKPILVMARFNPVYEHPLVGPLNLLVLVFIGLCLLKTRSIAYNSISIAAIILIVASVLTPFRWFGGMLRPDERMFFAGVLLLCSQISLTIPRRRLGLYVGVITTTLLAITAVHFRQVQPAMQAIHTVSVAAVAQGRSIATIAIMPAPHANMCRTGSANLLSPGSTPLLRASLYAALESRDPLYVSLFQTGLLVANEPVGGVPAQSLRVFSISTPEQVQAHPAVSAMLSDVNVMVMTLGCAQDVQLMDSLIPPGVARFTVPYTRGTAMVYQHASAVDP
jgi:hypothetical protein